jgi:membrane protein implicated in regulation of membrane protease activity
LTTLFMPAVSCIIAAIAFSMMGALMGTWWYLPAAVWAVMALVIAAVPELQFALFGGMWFVTQGVSGALLHRARRRKLGEVSRTP